MVLWDIRPAMRTNKIILENPIHHTASQPRCQFQPFRQTKNFPIYHSINMSTVSTAFLPLTTTFTAPAGCWDTTWVIQEVPITWWKQGGDNQVTCFPPAYPFSISSMIYSPGICPAGWTSACDREMTTSGQEMNVVSCCPSYVVFNHFGARVVHNKT
ncbi:hypothetical protein J1614_009790 [Plenodomus biglobosus]|nr:hypothetical protein J1614_009790 [Plenodomus biglobosus]